MAFSVVMPALEMAQETGKLLAWRKKEGDAVSKGEPLLEIETDKAVVEVEAPADGVLAGVTASEGADVPVGQTIAWIVAPGEQPPTAGEPSTPGIRATSQATPVPSSPTLSQAVSSASSVSTKISPKARRLAKELGVDISKLHGSGSGGEILASDVQGAATTSADATQNKSVEVPTTLGRLMAERTTQSWKTVPHFFVTREGDATALNQYRERIVDEIEFTKNVRVTHTDLLVALVSRVLLKHPRLNASWSAEGIQLHDHVNMGVAIAVEDGVVAPVIHNAHETNLADIAVQRRDIAERARDGKLRPADICDATFTISNLGMFQVDQFSAIIMPPQAAILAVGCISDRVVVVDGKPAVRPMMSLTLSCDHRVADGARAAMFLSDLAEALREPAKFLA
ncbi:MAG TPA: dihydrolipoamide acetyltransferase family protein [Candidatus Sulfotelmatobacter sp.]|nr:dihydrolipoamide acetyltransferase family protein [Candidatus Sulfotelmatobacter sp.]